MTLAKRGSDKSGCHALSGSVSVIVAYRHCLRVKKQKDYLTSGLGRVTSF